MIARNDALDLADARMEEHREFRLVRWFMLISLVVIALTSVGAASALSGYLTRQMLERDLVVSTQFVNSVVRVQAATSYFYGSSLNPSAPEMEEFFRHVAELPDVIRANVYGYDRSVLWSSDPDLIGKHFTDNEELEAVFRNDTHAEIEVVHRGTKQEHASFAEGTTHFIENYLPIWSEDHGRVVGAVEVYKTPKALLASIQHATILIWAGAAVAGLILFTSLTLIVRYANGVLRTQEARLVEAERLAVVGEMTSAVAHGLRNPLAAIRSCAELALEDDLASDTRRSISDIMSQSDRLEGWIRSFLNKGRSGTEDNKLNKIDDIVREALDSFGPQLQARGIVPEFQNDGATPFVVASSVELGQVLNSLISNSIEAIGRDGNIRITRSDGRDGKVRLTISDSGPGVPEEFLEHLFEPFKTGKPSGIGVGLALARRTVERLGGSLQLANAIGGGACATLQLPAQGTPA